MIERILTAVLFGIATSTFLLIMFNSLDRHDNVAAAINGSSALLVASVYAAHLVLRKEEDK